MRERSRVRSLVRVRAWTYESEAMYEFVTQHHTALPQHTAAHYNMLHHLAPHCVLIPGEMLRSCARSRVECSSLVTHMIAAYHTYECSISHV